MRKDYKSEGDRCSLDPQRGGEREREGAWKKDWRVRKIKLKRKPEEANREERQLQQPPANPESLGVSSPWENKKRASGLCQRHTGISQRQREQMSLEDVTAVTINLLSFFCLYPQRDVEKKQGEEEKKKKKLKWTFFSSAPGVWTVFTETERQPWLFNGALQSACSGSGSAMRSRSALNTIKEYGWLNSYGIYSRSLRDLDPLQHSRLFTRF